MCVCVCVCVCVCKFTFSTEMNSFNKGNVTFEVMAYIIDHHEFTVLLSPLVYLNWIITSFEFRIIKQCNSLDTLLFPYF